MRSPGAATKARDLYGAYVGWCRTSGAPAGSEPEFAKSMAARGFEKKRTAAGQVYPGVYLLAEEDAA